MRNPYLGFGTLSRVVSVAKHYQFTEVRRHRISRVQPVSATDNICQCCPCPIHDVLTNPEH